MDKKRLIKYLIITFLITWICWFGDALLVKVTSFKESDLIPMILFTIGGFGPTIAACFCLKEKFSLKALGRFLFGYKKNGILYLLLFVVIEIIFFVLSSGELMDTVKSVPIPAIAIIVVVFLQAAVLYGGNEEWGWRGTMQPILQKKLPYPVATLIVGVVWVCWHIPLWFIEGNSHQSMSFLLFAVIGIVLSYWLSAIYNASGSVVFCMLIHGLTNTLLGVFVIKINAVLIVGLTILTILAIWISITKLRVENQKQS